jgi:hypothetical protein
MLVFAMVCPVLGVAAVVPLRSGWSLADMVVSTPQRLLADTGSLLRSGYLVADSFRRLLLRNDYLVACGSTSGCFATVA